MDAGTPSGHHDRQGEEGRRTVWEPEPDTVRAAAAGDIAAFDELVRGYQEPLWRFLRHLVADAALAEDLAQEAFLRAYTRLGTFAFRSRFSTWLFQVARNLAIDALRRRDRDRAAVVLLLPRDEHPGPELSTELGAAIASLTPKLREALLLIEVGGFSYRDAGTILGVPVGTVKSRVFHARERLTAWFASSEGSADEV